MIYPKILAPNMSFGIIKYFATFKCYKCTCQRKIKAGNPNQKLGKVFL